MSKPLNTKVDKNSEKSVEKKRKVTISGEISVRNPSVKSIEPAIQPKKILKNSRLSQRTSRLTIRTEVEKTQNSPKKSETIKISKDYPTKTVEFSEQEPVSITLVQTLAQLRSLNK